MKNYGKFSMSVQKERGFIMKTAGKSVLKVLLSFTIAISCLIGIGMTSLADDVTISDFEYSGVYKDGYVIRITAEEYAIKSGPNTTSFVHKGDSLTVSAKVDDEGLIIYGFTKGDEFIQLSTPQFAFQTDGLVLKSGDGKSLETAFVFEVHSTLDDEQKVVQDMIDALPGVDEVTEEDRADIEAAREAYEALTDEQKDVVYINKLNAVENQIDKNKAAEVNDLIDAIGEVDDSDECRDRIQAARDAYEELTDNQRTYVTNYNDMFAAEEKYIGLIRDKLIKDVTDKINALPDADKLTIDDFYEVYEAEYLFFEELTEDEQAAFDPALKKKLDEAMNVEYLIFLDAGKKLLNDYEDLFRELDEEEYEWIYGSVKEILDEADALVAAGKTPDGTAFDILIWGVIGADSCLVDNYEFLEGDGAVWTEGSTDPIVVRIRRIGLDGKSFDSTYFRFGEAGGKIYVDGVLVDSKYFTAEEGSVILTILPDFLKTLSTGEHTLTVMFESANSSDLISVTTKFTVKSAAAVPASGESVSHYVVLGAALTLLGVTVFVSRKRLVDSIK